MRSCGRWWTRSSNPDHTNPDRTQNKTARLLGDQQESGPDYSGTKDITAPDCFGEPKTRTAPTARRTKKRAAAVASGTNKRTAAVASGTKNKTAPIARGRWIELELTDLL